MAKKVNRRKILKKYSGQMKKVAGRLVDRGEKSGKGIGIALRKHTRRTK